MFYSSEVAPIKERHTLHKPSDTASKYRVITIFISISFLYLHRKHEVLGGYENVRAAMVRSRLKYLGFIMVTIVDKE